MLITAAICFFVGQKLGEAADPTDMTGGYLGFSFFAAGIILIIVAMGALASFFSATPNSITAVFTIGLTLFIVLFTIIIAVFLIGYIVKYMKRVAYKKGKR
jgi:glucan phosphoethanolaminetransferase (alkaline phosphatase superfamily)